MCIEATNEHAAEDASFIKEIEIIEKSEKGRAFMKVFLQSNGTFFFLDTAKNNGRGVKILSKTKQKLEKVMTYLQFQLMAKHIRVTKPSEMPKKGSPRFFC